jgi:alpha-D-ribose 1-methylphosphonate 5-phosphate C-P lyase
MIKGTLTQTLYENFMKTTKIGKNYQVPLIVKICQVILISPVSFWSTKYPHKLDEKGFLPL